jgi:peptidoglycan hydrolase-like protein with peptidoglycan-binding domain
VTRRGRWIAYWTVACIVAITAAFVAGTRVRSPWDDAVANASVSLPVYATVEEHTFTPRASEGEGSVQLGTTLQVTDSPSSDGVAVVTRRVLHADDRISSGDLVAEVSGQSIVALALPYVLYRDLHPGETGPDVTALQAELKRLGFYSGTPDGVYGRGTSRAVRALFQHAGGTPPSASGTASDAVATARKSVDDAQTSAAVATEPAEAAAALTAARSSLASAQADADTPLPRGSILRIPPSGAVVTAASAVNATVSEESPLLTLRFGIPTVTVRVGVADADAFVSGAHATVIASGDSTSRADATVRTVSEFKDADAEHTTPGFDVELEFGDTSNLPFSDGSEVIAQIGAANKQDGPSVPLTAVRGNTGSTYVLTGDSMHPARARVTVAATDLKVGDRVLVTAGTTS